MTQHKTELYLQAPLMLADSKGFLSSLDTMLKSGLVSVVMCHSTEMMDQIKALGHDVAFTMPWTKDEPIPTDLEGVHLFDPTIAIKPILKEHKGLSIGCGPVGSCDDALDMVGQGASYVAFPAGNPELIQWWTTNCIVPCIAWGVTDVDQAKQAVEAGADFILPAPIFWQNPEETFKAITDLL